MRKVRERIRREYTARRRFSCEKFFYEKACYLRSGISLSEVLLITDSEQDMSLRARILEGHRLSEAMDSMGLFRKREISLIRLAEETGDLCGAFQSIHETLKAERELNDRIITVLIYPFLLMLSGLLFLLAAVYYIVPPLHDMLISLNTRNPVLAFLHGVSTVVPMPAALLSVLILVLYLLRRFRDRERIVSLVLGRNMERFREMRFIEELSLLSEGGLDLLQCFQLLHEEGYECMGLAGAIRQGKGFREAFRSEGYSPLLLGYVAMAEETGDFNDAFRSYHQLQKAYFADLLKRRTALIEPAAIILMGLLVFLLSFIIMIPMLDAYENI